MTIRRMTEEDIGFALALSNLEGWAYSATEFEQMFRFPHEGSLVWEEGSPAGFITSVQCGTTATIGHLVVSTEARGRNIGRRLLEASLAEIDSLDIESVLLFSTAQGERLYSSFGFRPSRGVVSYGVSTASRGVTAAPICPQLSPEDLDEACSIDERVFGDDRGDLLETLYRGHPGMCFKKVSQGRLTGYVFVRDTPIGPNIGPWASVTGSPDDAAQLLASALSVRPASRFDMGLFRDIPLAMRLVEGYQCVKRFDVMMMVRGADRYPRREDGALGIAAFELG